MHVTTVVLLFDTFGVQAGMTSTPLGDGSAVRWVTRDDLRVQDDVSTVELFSCTQREIYLL